jgi:predicted transcriptional regulator
MYKPKEPDTEQKIPSGEKSENPDKDLAETYSEAEKIHNKIEVGQTCQVLSFMSRSVNDVAVPADIVGDDTPCLEVLRLLEKNDALLVSKKYEIVGVINDMSLVRNIIKKDLDKLTAGDLSDPLVTIDAAKNVRQAITLMDSQNAQALAVTSKSAVFGLITVQDLRKFLVKRSTGEVYSQDDIIETKIDEFIALLKRGPVSLKDAQKHLEVEEDQIEGWIEILEKQNIVKIEKRSGKLVIKDERKI